MASLSQMVELKMSDLSGADSSFQEPVVNFQTALERLGEDHELLRDLARFYLEDSQVLLRDLQTSLAQNDAETVTRCCHSLSSLSLNFDGHRAARIAKEAEHQANLGNLSAVAEMVSPLQTEVQLIIAALKEGLLAQDEA